MPLCRGGWLADGFLRVRTSFRPPGRGRVGPLASLGVQALPNGLPSLVPASPWKVSACIVCEGVPATRAAFAQGPCRAGLYPPRALASGPAMRVRSCRPRAHFWARGGRVGAAARRMPVSGRLSLAFERAQRPPQGVFPVFCYPGCLGFGGGLGGRSSAFGSKKSRPQGPASVWTGHLVGRPGHSFSPTCDAVPRTRWPGGRRAAGHRFRVPESPA